MRNILIFVITAAASGFAAAQAWAGEVPERPGTYLCTIESEFGRTFGGTGSSRLEAAANAMEACLKEATEPRQCMVETMACEETPAASE